MEISIIIPIYNVEKYLARCLDSILALESVDWECILIDDGSTDQSWNIICEYAERSDRFIIRHKENGGTSSARNLGLEICTGDRIMFVDPDDYLFPEADQLLYQAVRWHGDCDMVIFGWADVFSDGTKIIAEIPTADFNNADDWIKKTVLLSPTMSICWSRLFKYSVIKENRLRFDESMRIAEDGYFVCEYLNYCSVIYTGVGNGQLYAYCPRQDSAIKSFYRKDILDELRTYKKKLELAENRNVHLSQMEEAKINSIFLKIIYRYAFSCAECCSLKKFRNIMANLTENEEIWEIINNCYTKSVPYKFKLRKFIMSNKLFGLYWYVLVLHKHLKNLRWETSLIKIKSKQDWHYR